MPEFKDRLRAARIKAGYTQGDLAKMIPCSTMFVCQWENGHRNINQMQLYTVCRVLDVSADYLLGLEKGE